MESTEQKLKIDEKLLKMKLKRIFRLIDNYKLKQYQINTYDKQINQVVIFDIYKTSNQLIINRTLLDPPQKKKKTEK